MKQQDIAVIIIIVFIAGVSSFLLASKFIKPSNELKQAEKVSSITPEFVIPDKKYFNDRSINPTPTIEIGEANNPDPFKDQEQ